MCIRDRRRSVVPIGSRSHPSGYWIQFRPSWSDRHRKDVLHGIRDEETCMDLPPTGERTRLRSGTPGYRRASGVLFVAGFMGFSMLYVAQGILPDLSRDFSVSPAAASLTLFLTTLPLAVAVLVAASWSSGQGTAMGLYISGTGLGGMTGRLAGGLLASTWSWRVAMAAVGGVCLIGGLWGALRLPSSRNFVATPGSMRERMARLRGPLRDPVIIRFALCGFVLMGSLVSFFNYLQYRLVGAPFNLSATLVALVFLLYLFGTVSANWMGRLADRRSRRGVLLLAMAIMAAGGLLTLSDLLPQVLAGAAAMVFGFFGAHSVTSGWVGFWATQQRAQSSALYLFGYHIGSSVAGFVGGLFFAAFGWPGEVGTVLVLLAVGLLVALSLPAARDHAPFAEPT